MACGRARGRLLRRWGPVRGWLGRRRAVRWRCGCGDGGLEETDVVRGRREGAGSRPESSYQGPPLGEWTLPSVHTPRKATTTPGYMARGAARVRPACAG